MEGSEMLERSMKNLTELSDLVTEVKHRLQELHKTRPQNDGLALASSDLDPLLENVAASLQALHKANVILRDLERVTEIPWLDEKVSGIQGMNMEYHSGGSPWDFCLRYMSGDKTLDEIHEALKIKFDGGQLDEFRTPPKEGTFVACYESKRFFRAIVLKFNPKSRRLLILKIDLNEEVYVQLSNTYQMPNCVGSIPCQVVRCCLTVEEALKKAWCSGLETVFKKTLKAYPLTVNVANKVEDSYPPTFLVKLYAYNAELMEEKNVSCWLNATAVKLKGVTSDTDDVMSYLEEDCFELFYQCEANPTQAPESGAFFNTAEAKDSCEQPPQPILTNGHGSCGTLGKSDEYVPITNGMEKAEGHLSTSTTDVEKPIEAVKEQQPFDERVDEPHPEHIEQACVKVSNWIQNYSDEEVISAKRKVPPLFVEPEFEEPFFLPSKVRSNKTGQISVQDSGVRGNSAKEPEITKSSVRGSGVRPDSSKQSFKHSVGHSFDERSNSSKKSFKHSMENGFGERSNSLKKSERSGRFRHTESQRGNASRNGLSSMSPSAPEFIPSCHVEIKKAGVDDDFDAVSADLSDEYQPQDDGRICFIFQKKGYCNRPGCSKEHVERTSAWTNDRLPIFQQAFNCIDLPHVLSEAHLRVEHVVDGNSFYATIPDLYSDINEFGVLETLKTLHDDLNSPDNSSSHPYLETPLGMTELVLALGLQRSLGPKKKWLRARILDVFSEDKAAEVFFCDFGNKEVVAFKDLRRIRAQFIHLPPQAVLTRLHDIKPVAGKEKEAKKYLERHAKGNILRAKIMSRNVQDAELDVILFDGNKNINNDLCALEFCLPITCKKMTNAARI